MTASLQPLKGQKALVTGANTGIGAATAGALAAADAAVVVNYVAHPELAQKVLAKINAAGGTALAIAADVSQESQVESMFAEIVQGATLFVDGGMTLFPGFATGG